MSDVMERRVLIVEDEPLLLEVSSEAFADAGYKVVSVASGDQGITLLQSEPHFDLLLTDIRMPGRIGGWTMAAEARRRNPEIAVIYVTGFAEEDGSMVPGSVLIRKPYRMRAVLDAAAQLTGHDPAA